MQSSAHLHGCFGLPQSSHDRVILHVDCDRFFLQVHELYDASLANAGPLVLWQYNDVICVSPEAKKAGVQKHMRPEVAQPLVDGIGGRMVHSFSRKWPGPRSWYGPYQKVSRDVMSQLKQSIAEYMKHDFVLERASIDEAYVDVSSSAGGSLDFGVELARHLISALKSSLGVNVSIGISRNRFLAKLASAAAKPPAGDGCHVVMDKGPRDLQFLLQGTHISKLPGFGGKEQQIAKIAHNIADLQSYVADDLQASLGLSSEMCARLANLSRGIDSTPVRAANPKQSLSVSSWLTEASLGDLALRHHSACGAGSVIVGGWRFEPHAGTGITNSTRARWLLLALVLDLEERVVEEYLEFERLPTKLTVTYQGPGGSKEPGTAGFTDGRSHGRSRDFPTAAFEGLVPNDARALASFLSAPAASAQAPSRGQITRHPVYGTTFLSSQASGIKGLADGAEALEDDRYCKRVIALLNPVAQLIQSWAREEQNPAPVAHLTITAKGMVARASALGQPTVSRKRPGGLQCTLKEAFQRPQKRVSSATPVIVPACIDISDSE